jgi:hypothetical protein
MNLSRQTRAWFYIRVKVDADAHFMKWDIQASGMQTIKIFSPA